MNTAIILRRPDRPDNDITVGRNDDTHICPDCNKKLDIAYLSTAEAIVGWCPCGCLFVKDSDDAEGRSYKAVYSFHTHTRTR